METKLCKQQRTVPKHKLSDAILNSSQLNLMWCFVVPLYSKKTEMIQERQTAAEMILKPYLMSAHIRTSSLLQAEQLVNIMVTH